MNYIRYWQSAGESLKTSTRIRTRMRQMIEEGLYTGGTVSFGYRAVKRGRLNKKGNEVHDLEVVSDEAELVKLIFEKTVREGYGSHRLASFLNDQGYRTHKGSKFQSMTINRILRNLLYCGYLVAKDSISPFIDELAILDLDTFARAKEILDQRNSAYQEERTIALNTKGTTLLSGNIFCGHCGSRMVTSKYVDRYTRKDGSEYRVSKNKYICNKKAHGAKNCGGQSGYISSKVDMAVVDVLHRYFDKIKETPQDKAIERKYQAQIAACDESRKKLTTDSDKLSKKLQSLNMEIANALVGESNFTASQLSEAIKSTQSQFDTTNAQLAQLSKELSNKKEAMGKIGYYYDQFLSWADEFESASNEERKMIAGQLLHKVKVFRDYRIEIEFDMNYQQFCAQI